MKLTRHTLYGPVRHNRQTLAIYTVPFIERWSIAIVVISLKEYLISCLFLICESLDRLDHAITNSGISTIVLDHCNTPSIRLKLRVAFDAHF
jgi:hypothetical protein